MRRRPIVVTDRFPNYGNYALTPDSLINYARISPTDEARTKVSGIVGLSVVTFVTILTGDTWLFCGDGCGF